MHVLFRFAFILSIMTTSHLNAQTHHVFAYYKNADKDALSFGQFDVTETKATKTYYTDSSQGAFLDTIASKFASLPSSKRNVLFFIHGLWADNQSFVSESLPIMERNIYSSPEQLYGLVINLQWHAGLIYKTNYEIATLRGIQYGKLIPEILEALSIDLTQTKVCFMIHSMGNIVFANALNRIQVDQPKMTFDKAILLAPDLPTTAFDTILKPVCPLFDSISLYYNYDDRTLQMANLFDPYPRLGIYGPANIENLPPNVTLIDKTGLRDNETKAGRMNLHRYYYTSPTVRKELLELLKEK
jgi:hypothetical protein